MCDNSSVQRSGLDSVSNSKPSSAGGIPLTGDAQADADIMAFVNARQNVLKQSTQFFTIVFKLFALSQ